jgi:hypothetical protein
MSNERALEQAVQLHVLLQGKCKNLKPRAELLLVAGIKQTSN